VLSSYSFRFWLDLFFPSLLSVFIYFFFLYVFVCFLLFISEPQTSPLKNFSHVELTWTSFSGCEKIWLDCGIGLVVRSSYGVLVKSSGALTGKPEASDLSEFHGQQLNDKERLLVVPLFGE